jgi:hypothetical protein
MADKVVMKGRDCEKKADKLMRGVSEFEGESAELLKMIMGSYKTASQGLILQAIKLADKVLLQDYPQDEVFHVYDLLQDKAKAYALLAMRAEFRAGWLRYELDKV